MGHFDAYHRSVPWQRLLRIKNKAAAKRNAKGRMAYLSAVDRYYVNLDATQELIINREWVDDEFLCRCSAFPCFIPADSVLC
ncbi:Uncharacterised protein [BD1-7 clade bacterium]|uniref:Uncharacterized protein n=1 Tax=BD1-7 clade bacterium TaxID=2029982 RepID=A0A5S9P648_9GAMM|nr:Uncharacterised protein [BD1-7 clade bacterium]